MTRGRSRPTTVCATWVRVTLGHGSYWRAAAVLALSIWGSAAAGRCHAVKAAMERMICTDPTIAARDAAMTQLYRLQVGIDPISSVAVQRRWLSSALSCRNPSCLRRLYDDRNAALLQLDGGRRVARRFHLDTNGRSGDLLIVMLGGWVTYDATETVVGSGGEAAGDISAARLHGTARMVGAAARETKPEGCEAILQRNADGSWSMATRHCFEGDRADLNERFLPIRS